MNGTNMGGSGPGRLRLFLLGVGCATLIIGCGSTREVDERAPGGRASEEVEIGYGTIEKDRFLGAASTIEGDEALERQPRTLAEMLRGHAGLQVTELAGSGVRVRIRGRRSLLADEGPLFVVDGMMVATAPDGGFYGVSPYDVESITVLKDAGSTAVYGSRGANGVIIIKTKRGR